MRFEIDENTLTALLKPRLYLEYHSKPFAGLPLDFMATRVREHLTMR